MTGVIAMQNLITFAVNLADNVMIGAYSQTALSGVAIVNQIQFLLQMLMLGTGSAIGVLGAQYWGKKELQPIRKATSTGVLLGVILSGIMMLAVFFFPNQTMGLLTNEQAVIAEGSKYLVIVCFSYVFFAVSNNLLSALRAVETVNIGFVVNLIALVVNITLNYGLIYGRLGMPEMGVEGAAIATLSARVVEFLVVVIYVLLFDKKICWRPKNLLSIDKAMFHDFIKVGMPLILANGIWGVAMSVQTAILGRLGEDTIAANSIATTLFQVVSVVTLPRQPWHPSRHRQPIDLSAQEMGRHHPVAGIQEIHATITPRRHLNQHSLSPQTREDCQTDASIFPTSPENFPNFCRELPELLQRT